MLLACQIRSYPKIYMENFIHTGELKMETEKGA